MALDFDKFAAKGKSFVKTLAKELGHAEDTDMAGRKLRAVLHAVRDILTIEESLQFISQLPMFLKAVYVDGWKVHHNEKRIRHWEEFVRKVKIYDGKTVKHDFETNDEVENAAVVIFMVLRNHISLGEMEDIQSVLPKELKFLARNVTMI